MTKNEKYAYLESSGWETKSNGLWWKKGGPNYRMNEAVDIQKEASEIKSVLLDPERIEVNQTPSMPESVKQTLDPYHHISAGYASEMVESIKRVREEIGDKLDTKVKTYDELTAREERLWS